MSRAPASKSGQPARRDYDRRKRRQRAPIRKLGRPIWRQPMMLGLTVLMLGLGGGGGWYAWKEGWLIAAQEKVAGVTHSVIAAVTPFKLTDVTVEGRDYVTREAILAALNVQAGDSLLGIDLQAARKRLEAIDWVASATVERRLPDTLYVTLKERRAVAIWQNGTEYTLIDKNGRTVGEPDAAGRRDAAAAGRPRRARACRRIAAAARLRAVDRQAPEGGRLGRAAALESGAHQRHRDLAA